MREDRAEPGKSGGEAPRDPEGSVLLIAERTIGELLGWDGVDWPAVARHQGRKFFFEQRKWQRSGAIYPTLKPLFDRCAPGNTAPLRPSPAVNYALQRLAALLARHGGELLGPAPDAPPWPRPAAEDRFHHAVIARILARLDQNPLMRRRAVLLQRINAAAEREMELHFCALIRRRLDAQYPSADPGFNALRIRRLREQVAEGIDELLARRAADLAGLSRPVLVDERATLIRVRMLQSLVNLFPWCRRYELLVQAELALIQQPLPPRFLPECALGPAADGTALAALDRTVEHLRALLAKLLPGAAGALDRPPPARIALCGCGALPLSGLLLHLLTGAQVTLIEVDPVAAEAAQRLVEQLARLEAVAPGGLEVVQHDATAIDYYRGGAPLPAGQLPGRVVVVCDTVVISAQLGQGARLQIARQLADRPQAPGLLLVRAADGLAARLAYALAPTEALSDLQLPFCGAMRPAHQIDSHLDRAAAAAAGRLSLASPELRALGHPEALLGTEAYRRLALPLAGPQLELGATREPEALLERLRAGEDRLAALLAAHAGG
jgi:hypothetical protein